MRTHHTNQRHRERRRFALGLTLIELLVVLLILAALAGVVLPHVSDLHFDFAGERKTASQIATEKTLIEVRAAILGTEGKKGLWRDLGEREADLPQSIAELFVQRVGWLDFDPNTRLGWRGPYVMDSGARDGANDPAILDGWGRPIVIQFPNVAEPDRSEYVRLISAGEDGLIDTPLIGASPNQAIPTRTECGDDLVLFLRTADVRP